MSRGVTTLPPQTLLSDRARDFLAHGPADAVTLMRHILQQPRTPWHLAEVLAAELLTGRPEFQRLSNGAWALAGMPTAPSRPADPAPAGPPALGFEEWRARRDAGRAAAPVLPAGAGTSPGRRGAASAPPSPGTPEAGEPLSALSWVVVDVETTGGSPRSGHRITEVAAVVVRDGEVREVYETLVNPQRPIPPEIVRLTGITMEMVRDKPTFREVCPRVVDALSGHVFVAHNAAFDWRFLSAEIEAASGRRVDGPRLCTVRLARKLLPHLRSRSLGYVADWYGADRFAEAYFETRHGTSRPWRHSAAGDAVATAHCLLRMLAEARDRGCATWGALQDLLGAAAPRRRRPRGRSGLPTAIDTDTTA